MNESFKSDVAIVPDALDISSGAETPFGRRWGGDVIQLTAEHLAALQAGQTLALDVQNEYVVFLKTTEFEKLGHLPSKKDEALNASGGQGHGG
jgi:hypothetical protein